MGTAMKWILRIVIAMACSIVTAQAQDQLTLSQSLKDCVDRMRATNIELARERIHRQCLNAASDSISGKQIDEWSGMVTYVYANNIHATLRLTSIGDEIEFISQAFSNGQPQAYKYLSERLIDLNLVPGQFVNFSGKVTLTKCGQGCTLPYPTPMNFQGFISITRLDRAN